MEPSRPSPAARSPPPTSPTAPPVAKRARTSSADPDHPSPSVHPSSSVEPAASDPPASDSADSGSSSLDTLRLLRSLTASGRPVEDAVSDALSHLPRLRHPVLAALRGSPELQTDLRALAQLIEALDDCVGSSARPRLALNVTSIGDVARIVASARNIVVLSGAGVSVSCGIPDFRSPGGLYETVLERFGLADPQAIFDLAEFRLDPSLFYAFAKDVMPSSDLRPSATHRFIAELARRGRLLRNYSQNIDGLEKRAGVPDEQLVLCHGSFLTATCMRCRAQVLGSSIADTVGRGEVPVCDECAAVGPPAEDSEDDDADEVDVATARGVLKPDITFFGEYLPERVNECLNSDLHKADLLLVLGTSLQVAPVARIPQFFPPHFPRILVNRELVDYQFDLELLGNCDAVVDRLRKELGWDRPPGSKTAPEAEAAGTEPATTEPTEGEGAAPDGSPDASEGSCDVTERADRCEFVPPRRFLFKGTKMQADAPVDDDDVGTSLVNALQQLNDDGSGSEDLAEGETTDLADEGGTGDAVVPEVDGVKEDAGDASKVTAMDGATSVGSDVRKTEEMDDDIPKSNGVETDVQVNGIEANDLKTSVMEGNDVVLVEDDAE